MTKLNNKTKAVQNCLDIALALDAHVRSNKNFSSSIELKLNELKIELKRLNDFKDPILEKLSKISEHLHINMSSQHFVNFLIPLERYLDRNIRDDDFLLTENDKEPNLLKEKTERPIAFILDNIRSAFNVGSIIRLADCIGASQVLLSGYTPFNDVVRKTSLHSAKYVQITQHKNVQTAVEDIKKLNYKIIALETSKNSKSIYEPTPGPTAYVVGNERFGLDIATLKLADEVRHIPLYGIKNSLNVANALSVAAFEWSRQNS